MIQLLCAITCFLVKELFAGNINLVIEEFKLAVGKEFKENFSSGINSGKNVNLILCKMGEFLLLDGKKPDLQEKFFHEIILNPILRYTKTTFSLTNFSKSDTWSTTALEFRLNLSPKQNFCHISPKKKKSFQEINLSKISIENDKEITLKALLSQS